MSSENTYSRMSKRNEYHFNVIFKCFISWSQLLYHKLHASWTQRFIVYVNMELISNDLKKRSNLFFKKIDLENVQTISKSTFFCVVELFNVALAS